MEAIRQLEAWWAYASRCAQLPTHALGCEFFWNALAIVAVALFALVALYIVRRMVRNFLAVREENARAAERARVADADTMAKYKADIDGQYPASAGDDVEGRIRQALDDRKTEEWGRPGLSRKPTPPA
jgi:flagellar biosynthesis/type III secretory pathway M-ring protein FliF/YscJ